MSRLLFQSLNSRCHQNTLNLPEETLCDFYVIKLHMSYVCVCACICVPQGRLYRGHMHPVQHICIRYTSCQRIQMHPQAHSVCFCVMQQGNNIAPVTHCQQAGAKRRFQWLMGVDGPKFHSHLAHQRVKLGGGQTLWPFVMLLPLSLLPHTFLLQLKLVFASGKTGYILLSKLCAYVLLLERAFINHASSDPFIYFSIYYYCRGTSDI